jgi:anion-transporting  ArsA/GET3 family ATPase
MTDNTRSTVIPRLVLLCGTGGVGKTSIAASLAYLGALEGRHTVAFTVDPARRLADTLGIALSDDTLTDIDLNTDSYCQTGSFQAAMLHLETAAKTLVEDYSPNPSLANKIITNQVFKTALRQMSNTEEYLAWGKVYQLLTDVPMDTLVIDTAPAGSAPNFFHAPDQLLRLLDPAHVDLIKKPFKFLFHKTAVSHHGPAAMLASFLSKITGKQWLDDACELVLSLREFYSDFYHRVHHLHSILQNPAKTSILLVSSTHPSNLVETQRIASMLHAANFPLKGIIFNRISPPFNPDTSSADKSGVIHYPVETFPADVVQETDLFIQNHRKQVEIETRLMTSFLKSHPARIDSYRIPVLRNDITSLEDLASLHPHMMDCLKYF